MLHHINLRCPGIFRSSCRRHNEDLDKNAARIILESLEFEKQDNIHVPTPIA
jgi:hypothetical protein